MDIDVEKLLQKYHNISKEELEKIRENTNFFGRDESAFELELRSLDERRENIKVNGNESVVVGPLVEVISAYFLPYKIDHDEPLSIYGRIYSECFDISSGQTIVDDFYNRMLDDAQVLGPSGSLTLSNSIDLSWHSMPFSHTRLVVDVYVWDKTAGYIPCVGDISCDEDINDLEYGHVKSLYVHNQLGVLTLRYILIPFGVYAHLDIRFFHKKGGQLDVNNSSFLNFYGKVVARYCNTYGGYDSGECTLFEKHSNEFQQVSFDLRGRNLRFSRCCMGLPVFSSLVLDMDLFEFGSKRNILKETLEFRVQNQSISYAELIVDDILIHVCVAWFSPTPQGRHNGKDDELNKIPFMKCIFGSSDDDDLTLQGAIEYDSNDEQMNEPCVPTASSNLARAWQLGVHRSVPIPCALVEIFSIFIGRENFKPLQVYGSVEVSSSRSTFYFNKEAPDAFGLMEGNKIIPVLDESFIYDDCESLEMKVDLKDIGSCFRIRGYVDWDSRTFEFGTKWLNKQLCSIVEGEHGFAAIHYSIFPEAVQASVGVLCASMNNVSGHADVSPKVYGSIVAQYHNFDYTSQYNKDYYRVVLFQRNQEDSLQLSEHGVISLSRSMVAVPLNSFLVIEVNLRIGDDQVLLQSVLEFLIGTNEKTLEINGYCIHVFVKWEEVGD